MARREFNSPGPESNRSRAVGRSPGRTGGRPVLEGAFRILRALPDAHRDHQVRDLAHATGIPRPSVYRLLAQLHEVGALERVGNHYVYARSFVDTVNHREPTVALREHARVVMNRLRAQTGATVSLVVPTEQGCAAIDVIPGQQSLPTPIYAGIQMPDQAAAALVLDPTPAPERSDPMAGWASDDARVRPDLTCYASAIRVGGRIEAVLQISTTPNQPATRFATLVRLGSDRIEASL